MFSYRKVFGPAVPALAATTLLTGIGCSGSFGVSTPFGSATASWAKNNSGCSGKSGVAWCSCMRDWLKKQIASASNLTASQKAADTSAADRWYDACAAAQ